VVISDDELKEAAPQKSAAIEIQEFVNESQIPTLYFEKPYYLEPDKGAAKAYALLREALAKSGKVGVAQFVLRNRESMCVLKAQGNALTLNTLRFASEIRSAEGLRLPVNEKLAANEVNLAMKLIDGMTAEFDPAKYRDTYSEDVKKLIEDKAKGERCQTQTAKPVQGNVIDLVAALQESLAQKKPRKRGAA
jgi:DNA end-binding protein Ku